MCQALATQQQIEHHPWSPRRVSAKDRSPLFAVTQLRIREWLFLPQSRLAATSRKLAEAIGDIASFGWITAEEVAQ
jgi:hypothetical protein